MSAFRAGHSWSTGNGSRSWFSVSVGFPLWFFGIYWLGGCWLKLLLLSWRIALWLSAEELLLIISTAIIMYRLIRRQRFRVLLVRLPYRLIALDTV